MFVAEPPAFASFEKTRLNLVPTIHNFKLVKQTSADTEPYKVNPKPGIQSKNIETKAERFHSHVYSRLGVDVVEETNLRCGEADRERVSGSGA